MARYTRRRGGGMRRTRRKRGYGKTNRRSRTGRMIYRRRRSGKINRRWHTYTFTRQVDAVFENEDPAAGSPGIHVDSMSGINPTGNMITPLVSDPTYRNAAGCTSWTFGCIFKLNNLPNVSEFINSGAPPAGLFEEYKITGVSVEFVPYFKNKDLKTNTKFISDIEDDDGETRARTYPDPTFYYATDHDGSNYLNWPIINEMGGVKKFTLNKSHKLFIRPRPVMPVAAEGAGGSVWGVTSRKAPWITNKATNVQHYGLRFLMTDWPGPSDGIGVEGDEIDYGVRILFRYYFKVRGVI